MLLGIVIDLVGDGEVFVRAHRPVLGWEIAHMAERSQHVIVFPQVFIDGFGL